VWIDDVGARLKYPKEYEAALVWRGKLTTRQDWERLLAEHAELFPPMW
jgi:hypothetical protein